MFYLCHVLYEISARGHILGDVMLYDSIVEMSENTKHANETFSKYIKQSIIHVMMSPHIRKTKKKEALLHYYIPVKDCYRTIFLSACVLPALYRMANI